MIDQSKDDRFIAFVRALRTYGRMDMLLKVGDVDAAAEKYSRGDLEITGERLMWWKNHQFHRVSGPAVIYADGTQWWYRDGKLHRFDGPAIIRADGSQEWWEDGKKIDD